MDAFDTRLIYSGNREEFENQVREVLNDIDDEITVIPGSVMISLSLASGPHFAALVTWQYFDGKPGDDPTDDDDE